MPPKEADGKQMAAFRLSTKTRSDLERLSDSWQIDKTQIVGHAIELLADHKLGAALGDSFMSAEQALHCWAEVIERASADNADAFTREEWNYLADTNNGCSPMMTGAGSGWSGATTMLWANAYDGHRLNRTGEKWFDRRADQRVAELVAKLRGLDFAHGWAVLVALQWFWQHPNEFDHAEDKWWTLAFRRETSGVQTS